MGPASTRRSKPAVKLKREARSLKRKRDEENLAALQQNVNDLDAKSAGSLTSFTELPLSRPTLRGLEASHFATPTAVQARAIPYALQNRDILCAAKTGSGKTLAFLIPVLEALYRLGWTGLDGLGALVVAPTRELATQTFNVLRSVGRFHGFSAGLIIGGGGGGRLEEERERVGRMNILIATPGRLLQHFDQTRGVDVDGLKVLVLDEADRILDLGFQDTVDAIVAHLPMDRQTMLFSATQTKKISDLARLSLNEPEYISVHEAAEQATPSTLQQNYVITPLHEKLNTLYSFIRASLKSKILVFLSSGKQVRFVYESFRHLQPGIPLLHLLGKQKQTARLEITSKFRASKNSCLFATDVVARGLDFPAVDWVVQVDCPEDADTYIHRVGRTARYERNGRAVLFLDPSEEEGMLQRLRQKKVPIEKINIRAKKQQSIQNSLQNLCFKDPELKYLGQKAFISYTKSVYLQKDKEIFQLSKLPLEDFAASLGLPGAPKIKYVAGDDAKKVKNAPRALVTSDDDDDDDDDDEEMNGHSREKKQVRTKYDRMFERRNQDVLADHYTKMANLENGHAELSKDADEDDDFLKVKGQLVSSNGVADVNGVNSGIKVLNGVGKDPIIIDSKRRERLLKSKKQVAKLKSKGTRLVYDDDGNARQLYELEDEEQFRQRGTAESQRAQFLDEERKKVSEADMQDKLAAKSKRREKREKRKAREAFNEDDDDGEPVVELVPYEENGTTANGDESPRAAKKSKKWFEDDSEQEQTRSKRRKIPMEEPETLEDLETLAEGLLG